ncbi:MAG: 30S ribosomal protein S24e [DPANN group archaeon]|nr:30S ribosomal protein S24e [DPANN group archaeon]
MKIEIINEKNNPLLHRKEIHATIKDYKKTPTRKEIIESVTAQLKAKQEQVAVDPIQQAYGKNEARAYIKIYENEEKRKAIEKAYKLKRVAEEKPAESPAEKPKETQEKTE